VPEEEKPEVGI